MMITKIDRNIIYENPSPHIRSRHGYFPSIVKLKADELVSIFVIGEAINAVNSRVHLSRSIDIGHTWKLEDKLIDESKLNYDFPISDRLKISYLSDEILISIGFVYFRENPDKLIVNDDGGFLPGENIITFSEDYGRKWSMPLKINHGLPEILEITGPCVELESKDIIVAVSPMPLESGKNPNAGNIIILKGNYKESNWNILKYDYSYMGKDIRFWENRICKIGENKLMILSWVLDKKTNKHLPNHFMISDTNGSSWTKPTSTGIMGQTANLIWVKDNIILTSHCQREGDIGIYLYLIEFTDNRWDIISKELIWNGYQNIDSNIIKLFRTLEFGQPSLIKLNNDNEFLLIFWAIENCQGKIISYKIKVDL